MQDEPNPIPNDRPPVWPIVIADMQARDAVGRERYGTPLQPFNGRDALADAYAECLDMAVYLKQAMVERDAAARERADEWQGREGDDSLPVTEEWLRSVGFTQRVGWGGLWRGTFRWIDYGSKAGAGITIGEHRLKQAASFTRGEIRQWCRLLGVPLADATAEAGRA